MKKCIYLALLIVLCATPAFAKKAMPRPAPVTAAEITAGTETDLRSYSPADVKSFIDTHGGADAYTVKVDAAATAAYLYNAGSGAVRAGTNVTIDDDGDYITINASLAGGAVDTEGTLNADEIAVMHDLDTIKSLTEAEFKSAFNMEAGTDYLAPISGDDPVLAFDETDGIDWELRVDDTGNSFEIGSSQGGIGDNVELEIDEDGDIHVTGDAYIEGALAEVGGTDPIYRLDETDGTDWEIRVDDTGNSLEIGSSAGGVGDNVELEIDEDGDIHVTKDVIAGGDVTATGDIIVTGDDIFATTNTAGYIWVGDDTNYNPVAVSSHATLAANGALTVVDFGLTADADAGDYDIKSVDKLEGVDAAVYVDLGTDGEAAITADTQITLNSPAILQYEATNDGNPYYKIGAANAEEAIFQSYYDSGAQTLDYFLIRTETADATADEGRIIVQIDEQQVLQIDDNGIEVGANGVDGTLKLYSEQGGTDYAVTLSPHATMTADTAYLLPAAKGTDGQYLQISSQATGQLTWATPTGSGDITTVGGCTTGDCFVDGSTTSTTLVWEMTDNDHETTLTAAEPTADRTITMPDETGTIMIGPAGLGTDNILAKMDGTGNLMQATGIVVDDSNNVSSVGTLGTTGDISIVTADPDLILDDSDGADGLIQIAANDADDSVMTLAVDDSGGDDQGYIELDGVNETVDILQNATFAGTVGITGAVTLSSTLTDGTATLNSGAWSSISTLAVTDAISLSDGATLDQSANNYVEITENSDNIQFGFGGTDVDLIWSDGALNIRNNEDSVDAIVEIEGKDAGEKGVLRVLSDGDDKYITAYHDDTDSWVASSSGDIILAPDGDVDDYVHISTATNVTSISAVGGDGTLGTAAAEWGGLFLGDGIAISFGNDQDVTLTHVADTGLALNLSLQIADDQTIRFGGAATDWYAEFDDSVDDQMLWHTTSTAAVDTGDPMFEILVDFGTANGTGMTADQEVFGVSKGTQASNVSLLALDEDGDLSINGTLTVGASGDSHIALANNSGGLAPSGYRIYFETDGSDVLSYALNGSEKRFVNIEDTQTLSGSKTFSSALNVNRGATGSGQLVIYEDSDNGTNTITLTAPTAVTASYTVTLPDGGSINQYLYDTDGNGTLGWGSPSASANTDGGAGAVQYNTGGALDSDASFVFTEATYTLTLGESNGSSLDGKLVLFNEGGTDYTVTIQPGTQSSNSTITLPGSTSTLATLGLAETFSGAKGFSSAPFSSVANTTALGTNAGEWADLYIGDAGVIYLGNDQDVTLTHVADTGVLLNSSMQIQLRDSAIHIESADDGHLDLTADTSIDLNGAVSASSTIAATGAISGNNVNPDAADGATLGTTSLEWSDIYLADGGVIYGQNDQSNYITSSATDWNFALDVIITGSDLTIGAAGVKLTGDGDGALTLLGLGDGSDEDLTINLDDVSNEIGISSSTSVDNINFGAIRLETTGDVTGGVLTTSKAASYTLGTDDSREAYGGIVYVTSAATITLPAIADGMSCSVITVGAIAVSVDTNASDLMYLDGTALDDGDKATNTSTTGDTLVCTYYSADGWWCMSGSPDGDHWTDGGP